MSTFKDGDRVTYKGNGLGSLEHGAIGRITSITLSSLNASVDFEAGTYYLALKELSKADCNCDSRALFLRGCKCGFILSKP